MRVIAGSAKGVRLAPVPRGVRPVSDRAREGLFSSLAAEVPEARVLDLFAGTGALGIEALSRGAERATFVERHPAALRALRENLSRTRLGDRAEVIAADATRFVAGGREGDGFDLALADPPYDAPSAVVESLLRGLAEGWVGGRGAVVVTRRRTDSTLVIPVEWSASKRLEYGDTAVLVFREA